MIELRESLTDGRGGAILYLGARILTVLSSGGGSELSDDLSDANELCEVVTLIGSWSFTFRVGVIDLFLAFPLPDFGF